MECKMQNSKMHVWQRSNIHTTSTLRAHSPIQHNIHNGKIFHGVFQMLQLKNGNKFIAIIELKKTSKMKLVFDEN